MGLPAAPLPRAITRQKLFKGAAPGPNSREKVGQGGPQPAPLHPQIPQGWVTVMTPQRWIGWGRGCRVGNGVLVKVTFQRDVAVGEGRLRNAEKEEVLCPATGPRKTE